MHDVHRFAFVQHLMKQGFTTEAKAMDAFTKLTGSDSGGLKWPGKGLVPAGCAADWSAMGKAADG